jgi:hypothetical protein
LFLHPRQPIQTLATAHPNTPGPKYTLGNGIISVHVPK